MSDLVFYVHDESGCVFADVAGEEHDGLTFHTCLDEVLFLFLYEEYSMEEGSQTELLKQMSQGY